MLTNATLVTLAFTQMQTTLKYARPTGVLVSVGQQPPEKLVKRTKLHSVQHVILVSHQLTRPARPTRVLVKMGTQPVEEIVLRTKLKSVQHVIRISH
jgi:hypothetical protein